MTNSELIRKIQAPFTKENMPDIRTGMEVEIYQIIKDENKVGGKASTKDAKTAGKERLQRFKGLVINTSGKSPLEKTITVRRKIGAFGVEKIFAIHSPTIDKIEILRQFKVRRKSIGFIKDLTGKAARLKEVRK